MNKLIQGALLMMTFFGATSCDRPSHAAADLPKPQNDIPTTQPGTTRTAVLAGGCFWCTEGVFDQLAGVSDVVSGYAGDSREKANYQDVSNGVTKHAEAIQITYDPGRITFGELLRVFFATHDPTTKDRQGPDEGRQYRSAVFYANDEEKRVAESYIKQLNDAKVFANPIVTTLEPLTQFYPAEDYHQNYVELHPNNPYIQQNALPKIKKVHEKFGDHVKPQK